MRKDFAAVAAEEVLRRLGTLNLPGSEHQSRERIEAAIVLLAGGDLSKFEHYAGRAEADWRDALMFSGLGNDDWATQLDNELGPSYFANPS